MTPCGNTEHAVLVTCNASSWIAVCKSCLHRWGNSDPAQPPEHVIDQVRTALRAAGREELLDASADDQGGREAGT